jgi:S1-C subfamily serine protease
MIKGVRKQSKKRHVVFQSSLAVVLAAATLGVLMASDFDESGSPASIAIKSANATVGHYQELNGPGSIADLAERIEPRRPEAVGSGVLISEDGYLLTHYPVLEDATKVTVTLANKDEYEAKIVGRDPKTALAMLKIEASEPLPTPSLGGLPELMNQGKVTHGYLGVTIQPIAKDLAKAFHLESTDGALVADVASGSPADKGGIETGDVIRAFNGVEVKKSHQLSPLVANTPVGADAQVVVERKGEKVTLSVRIAELDSDREEPNNSSPPRKVSWGLQLQDLTPKLGRQLGIKAEEGVLVAGVQPGGSAHRAGVRRGDVILEVNRSPVFSVDDAVNAIGEQGEDPLLLSVRRGQVRRFIVLTNKS